MPTGPALVRRASTMVRAESGVGVEMGAAGSEPNSEGGSAKSLQQGCSAERGGKARVLLRHGTDPESELVRARRPGCKARAVAAASDPESGPTYRWGARRVMLRRARPRVPAGAAVQRLDPPGRKLFSRMAVGLVSGCSASPPLATSSEGTKGEGPARRSGSRRGSSPTSQWNEGPARMQPTGPSPGNRCRPNLHCSLGERGRGPNQPDAPRTRCSGPSILRQSGGTGQPV